MPGTRKARRNSSRLRLLAVCLCAAVFAWGFQAKLSLYHPAAPLNPEHVAKLMADNQGSKSPVAAVSGLVSEGADPDWIVLGTVTPRLRSVGLARNQLLLHPAAPGRTHALFFRPPPQTA
ncbi:MAG TPA: hypothetical protein VMU71_11585 [Terracidiphilus sp.]|nr:hypothetical protein [Terracidiphilus sp.]